MGLDDKATQFLLAARQLGVSFERTATIGRQRLYVTTSGLAQRLSAFGIPTTHNTAQRLLNEEDGYSEPFFRLLGAVHTESFDASNYEGASHALDLNQPIPPAYAESFTAVVDSGTLEHVFNFPEAIRNCMQMVKLGGHLVSITNVNNLAGHGFYQFSPELFYRVLSEKNGFTVTRLLVTETSSPHWYEVTDPVDARGRVQLRTFRPTYLCVVAQRTTIKPIFSVPPQQSDYVAQWHAAEGNTVDLIKPAEGLHPIEQRIPARLALVIKSLYHFLQATVVPFDRRTFRRVAITELTTKRSS